MPLYRCFTEPDSLDDGQRAAIAQAITDIHCDATTAPPSFVHVQFLDRDGDRGGGRGDAAAVRLHGGLRAGRPPEVTETIIDRCRTTVAEIAGIDVGAVSMRTSETPASWIFEGGRVLPEPGEEEAWQAAVAR